jgi:hypothetical protein
MIWRNGWTVNAFFGSGNEDESQNETGRPTKLSEPTASGHSTRKRPKLNEVQNQVVGTGAHEKRLGAAAQVEGFRLLNPAGTTLVI